MAQGEAASTGKTRRDPGLTGSTANPHAIAVDLKFRLLPATVADLAEETSNAGSLVELAQLAAQYNDARAMLMIGKTALARGLPIDLYAFPDVGVPPYSPVGAQLDRCIVYSIVRTETEPAVVDEIPQ